MSWLRLRAGDFKSVAPRRKRSSGDKALALRRARTDVRYWTRKARGKAKAKSKPGGGGFGAAPKKAKPAPLDRDAQSLLDRANGDLDAAQGMMFQDGIAALQAADPALYAKMAAQQGGGALSADVHEKLVEATNRRCDPDRESN